MASFAQIPTLVFAAVLGPDASAADLARLAFGVLLWIVLVVVNHGPAGTSPSPSALEVGAVPNPRPPGAGPRRLESARSSVVVESRAEHVPTWCDSFLRW